MTTVEQIGVVSGRLSQIEDIAIRLRKGSRLKLPDSIIAASALSVRAEVLTFDKQLSKAMLDEIVLHETGFAR